MAPRGNIISTVGNPSSVAHDLAPTIHTNGKLPLDSVAAALKGVQFLAAGLRKLVEWRAFLNFHNEPPPFTQPKILTHSGHNKVSIMHSDKPHGRAVSSSTARAIIHRITGAPYLGILRFYVGTHCPKCGLTIGSGESLERHVVLFPNWGMRHMMHSGMIGFLVSILTGVRLPYIAVVTKARGL